MPGTRSDRIILVLNLKPVMYMRIRKYSFIMQYHMYVYLNMSQEWQLCSPNSSLFLDIWKLKLRKNIY